MNNKLIALILMGVSLNAAADSAEDNLMNARSVYRTALKQQTGNDSKIPPAKSPSRHRPLAGRASGGNECEKPTGGNIETGRAAARCRVGRRVRSGRNQSRAVNGLRFAASIDIVD